MVYPPVRSKINSLKLRTGEQTMFYLSLGPFFFSTKCMPNATDFEGKVIYTTYPRLVLGPKSVATLENTFALPK